jgi:hypothetical protein
MFVLPGPNEIVTALSTPMIRPSEIVNVTATLIVQVVYHGTLCNSRATAKALNPLPSEAAKY